MSEKWDPIKNPVRLKILKELLSATTDAAGEFDSLASEGGKLLQVPISLITFVDSDKQILRGQYGLPATLAMIRKMPISYSICQYTVREPKPLIIPDTDAHQLLKNQPSVTETGIRAYLGIPYLSKSRPSDRSALWIM